MFNPSKILNNKFWWSQFPFHLRLITKIRFFASFGAGGVIYLTSLIFNSIGLSATEIGLGFTVSAIIGTITRFFTGNYLNKTGKIESPLIISSMINIAAGFFLIISKDTYFYIVGEGLIGAAAGIYWPTAEFVVPYFCIPIDTRKAYALVRSSEALGIFLGVFWGGVMNNFIYFKSIFINDIFCMITIIILILRNKKSIKNTLEKSQKTALNLIESHQESWNKNTYNIVLSVVLITSSLALIQITLPLDLVKGGIHREALNEQLISFIISFQLILLLFLQWPIGSWVSKKGKLFGLKFSLINFASASLFLFISSYISFASFSFVFIAIILVSLGTSSFLPTSTDVIFSIAPSNKKGYALALLSQCFAMGYFFGPFISGRVLDLFGYASIIWIAISLICFSTFTMIFKKLF